MGFFGQDIHVHEKNVLRWLGVRFCLVFVYDDCRAAPNSQVKLFAFHSQFCGKTSPLTIFGQIFAKLFWLAHDKLCKTLFSASWNVDFANLVQHLQYFASNERKVYRILLRNLPSLSAFFYQRYCHRSQITYRIFTKSYRWVRYTYESVCICMK